MTNQTNIPQQPVLDTPHKREIYALVMETFGKDGRFGYSFLFLTNLNMLHSQYVAYELYKRATPDQWEFLSAIKVKIAEFGELAEKATDHKQLALYLDAHDKLIRYGRAYCDHHNL